MLKQFSKIPIKRKDKQMKNSKSIISELKRERKDLNESLRFIGNPKSRKNIMDAIKRIDRKIENSK